MALGSFDRDDNLSRLAAGTFDILVVGGGVTGAGVALDAASRGLRTALVERDDFASGTSSKSSKLVHGGLRYLQNGDVRLVYEALHERQRLLRNAPHLVKVLPFLIPVFTGKGGIIPKQVARALGSAMWMYDLTGGLRIGKVHRRLRADAARAHMPTLGDRLAWAYLYYDAQADDARLTLTLARTAALDYGATVVNHAGVVRLVRAGDRVAGAVVDTGSGEVEVRARVVVNATGVWADDVRALDDGTNAGGIRPAKGIHITVPWEKVRNDIAAVVPVREDRRSVFVVPLPGADGTVGGPARSRTSAPPTPTSTATSTIPSARPRTSPTCSGPSTSRSPNRIDEADVLGTWAGLRPLVSDACQHPHGRPVPTAPGHDVALGPRDRRGREAHHVPRDGRGRRGRGGGHRRRHRRPAPPPGRTMPHPQAAAPWRRRVGRGCGGPSPPRRALRRRDRRPDGDGGNGPGARRAARARPALPQGRSGVRGALRDGDHPRRRARPPHPGPPARRPRHRRGRRRRGRPRRARARVVARRRGRPGARRTWPPPNASAPCPACPTSPPSRPGADRPAACPRVRARRGRRRVRIEPDERPARPARRRPRRPDAADRPGRGRRRRHRPPGRRAGRGGRRPARPTPRRLRRRDRRGRRRRRGQPRLVATGDVVGDRRARSQGWRPPSPGRPTRPRWRPCWPCATRRGCRSPPPADAAACAARPFRCTAASCSTSPG